jgi:2-aminoadipate transaminase
MKDALDHLLRHGAASPTVIAMAGGLPSEAQFPRRALSASFLRAVQGAPALQYGWPEGLRSLREQIAHRLNSRGAPLTADDVLLTSGAQQAIAIACQLVCKPGDRIGVDTLTYASALDLFRARGLVLSVDDHAGVAYVMPVVGNPGGRPLPPERRQRLLSCRDGFVIEDDAYAELAFAGPPCPPMVAEAPARVFHVGTLSKVLCPGLRVGWLVPPRRFRKRAWKVKQALDLQSSNLAQAVASDYLAHHNFERRLAILRRFYRRRAARLLEVLKTRAPSWIVQPPAGGFSVWVETQERASEETFLRLALAEGVSFDPGSAFRAQPGDDPLAFRLCYSAADPAQFDDGVRRLVRAWRRATAVDTVASVS